MGMSSGEAASLRIKEALGAHIIADAYRDTFPDSDEDAAYLRKQETYWRLLARSWLVGSDESLCTQKAKYRASDDPRVREQLDQVRASLTKST